MKISFLYSYSNLEVSKFYLNTSFKMGPAGKDMEAEAAETSGYMCSFIPEYVLEAIQKSSSTKLDTTCRRSAESTIRAAHECHEHRGCLESKVRYY